jgi:hypothetical protein
MATVESDQGDTYNGAGVAVNPVYEELIKRLIELGSTAALKDKRHHGISHETFHALCLYLGKCFHKCAFPGSLGRRHVQGSM